MAGRPLGTVALAVLDAVSVQPMTSRELSERLQLSSAATRLACHRLSSAKYLGKLPDKRRHDGADKPSSVYIRLQPAAANVPSSPWCALQVA